MLFFETSSFSRLVAVFKISVLLFKLSGRLLTLTKYSVVVKRGCLWPKNCFVMLCRWKDEKQSYILILKHRFGYQCYIYKTTKYAFSLWRVSLKKWISGSEKRWKMAKNSVTLFCIRQIVYRATPPKWRNIVI